MTACKCSEKKRPFKSSLPKNSNERPRQWFVINRNHRHYKSPGRFGSTWSDYSRIECRVCGGYWKTKAKWVNELDDCEYFPNSHAPKVEPYENGL